MVVTGLLYLMTYNLSGVKFGFFKSVYTLNINNIFKRIIPLTFVIISVEIIRCIFIAQSNKLVNVTSFITFIIVDILLFGNLVVVTNFNTFMDLMAMTLLPAVTSNVLYQYLSKRYGIYPNIVFRLIITLYPYIIPYVPATPDSLVSFCKLIIPLLIYYFIDALYEKKRKYAAIRKSKWGYVAASGIIAALVALVMLISCQFRFGMLVIATDSMTGEINIGDAIIYERYEEQIIGEGDIIVFLKGDAMVVHRVVDIKKINNQNRYYTKGDANDNLDAGFIIDSDIVGITNIKVSYIGYPTLWIRNIFLD
jgi:signal peptidase